MSISFKVTDICQNVKMIVLVMASRFYTTMCQLVSQLVNWYVSQKVGTHSKAQKLCNAIFNAMVQAHLTPCKEPNGLLLGSCNKPADVFLPTKTNGGAPAWMLPSPTPSRQPPWPGAL